MKAIDGKPLTKTMFRDNFLEKLLDGYRILMIICFGIKVKNSNGCFGVKVNKQYKTLFSRFALIVQ